MRTWFALARDRGTAAVRRGVAFLVNASVAAGLTLLWTGFTPTIPTLFWTAVPLVLVLDTVLVSRFSGTLGHRLLGLRVIDDAGRSLSLGRSAIRSITFLGSIYLALLISDASYRALGMSEGLSFQDPLGMDLSAPAFLIATLGLVLPSLLDPGGRALHDHSAGSQVTYPGQLAVISEVSRWVPIALVAGAWSLAYAAGAIPAAQTASRLGTLNACAPDAVAIRGTGDFDWGAASTKVELLRPATPGSVVDYWWDLTPQTERRAIQFADGSWGGTYFSQAFGEPLLGSLFNAGGVAWYVETDGPLEFRPRHDRFITCAQAHLGGRT